MAVTGGEAAGELSPRVGHIAVSRTARYAVLGEPAPGVRDWWWALHGYGQLAERFVRRCAPLAAPDRLVVAPEALSRFYRQTEPGARHATLPVGATWMTREDRLEEIRDYVAYLDALHAHLGNRTGDPRRPARILGFSQGVATACRWVALGAVPVAMLVCWGGTIPDDLDEARFVERLGGAPVVVVAGERDELTPPETMRAHHERLRRLGVDARLVVAPVGHRLDDGVLGSLAGG